MPVTKTSLSSDLKQFFNTHDSPLEIYGFDLFALLSIRQNTFVHFSSSQQLKKSILLVDKQSFF